jgi:glycogen debranching enzyme
VVDDLRARVHEVMADHWRSDGRGGGYAVPNTDVYPHQWLWDSCFHALVWAELGEPERAVAELTAALADQAEDGFVPHIRYLDDPEGLRGFWGRPATSSITQPPMYGHAIAELRRRGVDVPAELVERARLGLRFLLDRRARSGDGLVTVVHPWETGCDDSPRWDSWCDDDWNATRWYDVKGELVHSIERAGSGSPIANPAFDVAPAGFNALVAFNARELGMDDDADPIVAALDARWSAGARTWVDGDHRSGAARTLDALLPLLVLPERTDEVVGDLLDDRAFGGPFGPPAVHRAEPAFDPDGYWRGSAWPQLTYLLTRAGAPLADRLRAGATRSGLAEHWNPDTGHGLGAVPQSWAGLAVVVSR